MTEQKGNKNCYDQETFNGTAGCGGFARGYSIYRGGQGRDCQCDGSGDGRGKFQPPHGYVFFHELFQLGLVNGDGPGLKSTYFFRIIIHANDVMAHFGKTGACGQPHVTTADNC